MKNRQTEGSRLTHVKRAIHQIKNVRNDLFLKIYTEKPSKSLHRLLENLTPQAQESVVVCISFNQPRVIEWMLDAAKKFINDPFIIADNSSSLESRRSIKNLCDEHSVSYVSLPANKTRHANRSHGMAMQWCYKNIISNIKPKAFSFVDHDLIPIKPVEILPKVQNQPFYGLEKKSKINESWQLWAGYCMFNFKEVSNFNLNFLYDFANGLDTGGRNYHRLYKYFRKDDLMFASKLRIPVDMGSNITPCAMMIIDDSWVHMGGAGHRDNFAQKHELFRMVLAKLGNSQRK
jgi:hypothetical protein